MSFFPIDIYLKSIFAKKPKELVFLDLKDYATIADFIIICHGDSNRQVSSIASHVKLDLRDKGIFPLSFEGIREGNWAILDYDRVVIHVFQKIFRDFYDLEGLWFDVKKIKIEDLSDFLIKSGFLS